VTVDPEHRSKAHFTGEVDDVANKPKPIVFINVSMVAVNKLRCSAFIIART